MKDKIKAILDESASLKAQVASDSLLSEQLSTAAQKLMDVIAGGGTIYLCGNGGSACDAMHFTEELIGRYKRERNGIRATHFIDGATLTCWSNDYDYNSAFARHAEVFCTEKDVLIAISTSGNSKNILAAVEVAKSKNCYSIGFAGKEGGALAADADLCLVVPSSSTERIQEVHITFVHILCELVETEMRDFLQVKN